MFNQEVLKKIKEITEEFFQKTTFSAEVDVLLEAEGAIQINIKTEDPQILIGEGGQTLAEIQHLLKMILKRKIALFEEKEEFLNSFYINLDINNYKQKKYDRLREAARVLADEAVLSKKEKELPPMTASERRIVHMELASRTDVTTDSIGQEPERKIIIVPRQ